MCVMEIFPNERVTHSLTINEIPVHHGISSLFKCNAAAIQVCAFLSPVLYCTKLQCD